MNVSEKTDELAKLMAKQLRVSGAGLSEVSAKAGRKLPRYLRSETEYLLDAERMSQNPKLARMVDEKRIAKAERKLRKFLEKQNPRAERRGEILDRIAAVAFVVLTIILIVFFTMLARGAFD